MAGPIATQTAQAACLGAISNVIAQHLASSSDSFSLSLAPLAKYVLYSILNTPLNCLWQDYLESTFPGETKPAAVKENAKQSSRKNWGNVVAKFVLDQTVGAAGNILFFLVVQGLLRGASLAAIGQSIADDSMGVYLSGMVIWPAVSCISFLWIPVERRVVFGCIVGVAWGVYLGVVAMHQESKS